VLIDKASLSRTVDAVNAAHFEGRSLAAAERTSAANWIAARQGLPGCYGRTCAGFPAERAKGIVVFTGERITSASARHILGEESSRALRLLCMLKYAAPALERMAERPTPSEVFARRRHVLATRVLNGR
jgi:hypothetical protein